MEKCAVVDCQRPLGLLAQAWLYKGQEICESCATRVLATGKPPITHRELLDEVGHILQSVTGGLIFTTGQTVSQQVSNGLRAMLDQYDIVGAFEVNIDYVGNSTDMRVTFRPARANEPAGLLAQADAEAILIAFRYTEPGHPVNPYTFTTNTGTLEMAVNLQQTQRLDVEFAVDQAS